MRTKLFILAALAALLAPVLAPLRAQEPSPGNAAEPQLRMEAGMHTAVVRHIAVSADGRTIVTSSYDKTIRIWSVPDGKLQKVLRVPIGDGFEGSLFAVALSSDGRTIAAGGWTKQNFIYLLDATNGTIVKSLGPNPEVTNNLAFSPDGRSLVTVFGRGSGMRMFDVASGTVIAEDKNYGDDAYGVAFRDNGTFATAAYDGMVRLYAQDGSLLTQLNAPSGQKAFSVAFTPDGSKLAVGYNDVAAVDIFSTSDYDWLPKPDLSGISGGDLGAVTWSTDGTTLYAGGAFKDQLGWYVVVRWRDQGKGERSFVYQAGDAVFDLEPYGPDAVAVGAAVPSIAVVQGDQKLMELLTPISSMGRGEKGVVTSDPTGRKVRFSLDVGAKKPVEFDLDTLELKDVTGTSDSFAAPDTDSLKITDWYGKRGTKLGDTVLPVDQHEMSFSLAISPDKSNFILGTAWYVRKYDAQGKFLWRTAVTGVTWGVTYAQDGKVVIAALGDGTIRWFSAEDGKEILSLFVNKDDKRWVLWSPGGYYAASPGGEDLIGWNVNRSETETPDFFSAARFRNTFYRPDIVQKITQVLNEEQAVKEANAAAGRQDEKPQEGVRGILPAVVELAMDSDVIKTATSPIEISYRVRSPSGEPIESMEVLINGRPLEGRGALPIPDENEVNTIDVPIPSQDVEIGLIAHTKMGASEVRIVKVKWDGAFAELLKPKLYAVVVGVSDYQNSDLRLKYAAKDASDFAADLQRQEGGLYGKVNIKLLTNEKATRDDIVAGLDWLEGEVTSRDVGMVFLAGHGVTDTKQRFYFLPVDADMDKLRATAVSRDDLLETMSGLAGKALMFIDACHSATSTQPGELARGAPADITQVVNELSSVENGIVMFASSTGRQLSIESDAWHNGAFTKALIEGLSGAADYQHDGKLTVDELDLYLSDRVKELTNKRQSPVVRKPDTIPDFPIALVR